jgi:hypothetical protein
MGVVLVGRTLPVVERLPIVVASRLIGYPGLEIWLGGVRVVVLVVGAVIPVVPRVRLAVWGLPLVVDMDPVPILAVEGLLLVFLVVLVAPGILRGLRIAVVGAIRPRMEGVFRRGSWVANTYSSLFITCTCPG